MNSVGVGVSRESNPEAAVAEVLNSAIKEKNLPQVHWVMIFFTPDHFVHAGRLHELIREQTKCCLLYTSPSPRDGLLSRMPSSA